MRAYGKTLPKGAIPVTTYCRLQDYIDAFGRGLLKLLILIGSPGLQKSQLLRQTMSVDSNWVEGSATAFRIYCRLWEFRHKPVIIDDVDGLYSDRAAVRLLKCLCQTDEVKNVAWHSDAKTLDQQKIPRSFTTTSRVAIIGNAWRTANENVAAIEDRGHLIVFDPSPLEVHHRTACWFWDQEVFDFIGERLHLIPAPSMRCYVKAAELKQAGLEWQSALLSQWLTGPAMLAAQLLLDPSFSSQEDRAAAFTAAGAGCRATFFNHSRRLRPKLRAPRIRLRNKKADPGPSILPLNPLEEGDAEQA